MARKNPISSMTWTARVPAVARKRRNVADRSPPSSTTGGCPSHCARSNRG
ncbi:hypothetical protein A176_003581 [Myxococcus hansupus]|uniref:Uncharacterized protein n=1 Tax=Pseudomyxococcus hansupus TaxID=1297742 RepID=A0A0H4WV31_9BACT|nr:hypothetical protein A176_003581 [Myxococcus hansupus]